MKAIGILSGIGMVLVCALAEEPKGPAVEMSDAEFNRLVEQTARIVGDALKGNPKPVAIEKARTTAIVMATVAQYSQGGKNSPRRATVRDAALRVAAAIKNDKYDDAVRQANGLAKLSADKRTKPAPVPIMDKQIELGELMHHFATAKGGGTDAEKNLTKLAENKQAKKNRALPDRELNGELALLALRSAAVGELLKDHMDNKVKKQPKLWRDYAEAMRQSGIDLAKAAREKKGAAGWKALHRLNASCDGCHKDFK